MDTRTGGVLERLPGSIDVGSGCSRQGCDHRSLDLTGDGLDGSEVAVGCRGEAGLDDVHPQSSELGGDLELLLGVEGDTR